jgi:hypothetical protein
MIQGECIMRCCTTTAGCAGCLHCNPIIVTAPRTRPVPHCCPVCRGNGLVDQGFYGQTTGTWLTSGTTPEQCRSCAGTGIVWR